MKIALCSDESYPVHATIVRAVQELGHEVVRYGAFVSEKEVPWALAAEQAAVAIATGQCDQGIFLCWTGTGISIAANKVPGIRAALCVDAETAVGARVWNHANVLCMSNRLLSEAVAKEMIEAWFQTPDDVQGLEGVKLLREVEKRQCPQGSS